MRRWLKKCWNRVFTRYGGSRIIMHKGLYPVSSSSTVRRDVFDEVRVTDFGKVSRRWVQVYPPFEKFPESTQFIWEGNTFIPQEEFDQFVAPSPINVNEFAEFLLTEYHRDKRLLRNVYRNVRRVRVSHGIYGIPPIVKVLILIRRIQLFNTRFWGKKRVEKYRGVETCRKR